MHCKSEKLIYCATCANCGEHSIGQTKRLNDRVSSSSKSEIQLYETRRVANILRTVEGKNLKFSPFFKCGKTMKFREQLKNIS